MSQLVLALQGNLRKAIEHRTRAGQAALRTALTEVAGGIKLEARRDVTAALGSRMGNTIQDYVFPREGQSTWSPAASVIATAPGITKGHDDGVPIRARFKQALAIPIDKEFLRDFRSDRRVAAPNPRDIGLLGLKRTYGGFFTIKRPGKAPVLAVNYRGEVKFLYTLAKAANMKDRLDTRQIFAKGKRRFPARLSYHWGRALQASMNETAL